MTLSLPATPALARSLTDVVPQVISALNGAPGWFRPARSGVVCVIDGLGSQNLAARAGHARFLAASMSRKSVAQTVFPSTTAAALTSLWTGTPPGEHGVVGYRAYSPESRSVVNQLHGWDTGQLDPHTWQRRTPILEIEAGLGRRCCVVSKSDYERSGFTEAILRGAEFLAVDDLDTRLQTAVEYASRHDGALVYVYAAELDQVGHGRGWSSDAWIATLERVDKAVGDAIGVAAADVGVVVTADHGMVDVPADHHVLLGEDHPLWEGVALLGGEPRVAYLYTEPGQQDAVRARWFAAEGARSWVLTRPEAIAAGLFGPTVDDEVAARIGDVIVAARGSVVYYDDRGADKRAQSMVGQHGSLTPAERSVPLIRLAAFA